MRALVTLSSNSAGVCPSVATGRNSVGVEVDPSLGPLIRSRVEAALPFGRERARARLRAHEEFVATRTRSGKAVAHRSTRYGFPVMTRQEVEIRLTEPTSVRWLGEVATVDHVEAHSEPTLFPVR